MTPLDAQSAIEIEKSPLILPDDEYNRKLAQNAHPADWLNPTPEGRYNLVVLGGGTAGLVAAAGAAGLGAKVALIERHLMGGDCLNVGCVPSKALIGAARVAACAQSGAEYGVAGAEIHVDFPKVMERMRRLRGEISKNDSVLRYKNLGVDVFLGEGRFVSSDTVEVDGKKLRFSKAVITTGARAVELPISGLKEAGYLTNETVFSLTKLPKRLVIIGAGPIGCELGQAFRRFGSEVTLIEAASQILPREDRAAAAIIEKAFQREKIAFACDHNIIRVEKRGSEKIIFTNCECHKGGLVVDEILVGIGRAPNVEGLNCEAAQVEYDKRAGVKVNDRLQTTNPKIYASGDICSAYKFTHTADALSRIVIQNALFGGRKKASALVIPWCTYTDPEIAHVGLYEKEAQARGIAVKTLVQEFKDVDRAVLDGQSEGFVKVHARAKTDEIIGATIVASHAGEMIGEMALAMTNGLGLKALAQTIHPYPTQAEAMKKIGDAYNRTRLTPSVKSIFATWLKWTR